MQIANRRADCGDITDLPLDWRMRVAEEGMRDKRFLKADLPKPLTSHKCAKKVPGQLPAIDYALSEGYMVGCHNNLRD